VSAHYIVSESGHVWQMVRETQTAWHVGCCNSWSIGIEHEGFAAMTSHPQALYDTSALLARHLCNRWGIPKEKRIVRPGIIGHVDVTRCCCGSHTDPGNGWDWAYYLNQVNGTPPGADQATFISSTIPEAMVAGQSVSVEVTFKNTGITTWTAADGYKLGAGDDTDPFSAANRQLLSVGESIAPNAHRTFTLTLTAPASPGAYVTDWRLLRENIAWFGDTHSKTITVALPQNVVIVESRSGGQNTAWYSEQGTWADNGLTSSAPGTTTGIGSRYGSTYRSIAGLKSAVFAPILVQSGHYEVAVTWPEAALRRSPILHQVTHAHGTADLMIDQSQPGNQWVILGTYFFVPGSAGTVRVSNESLDVSGNMYTSAARFTRIDATPVKGDWDGDGDVDQADFGWFQRCFSGQAVPQNEPLCAPARLDGDSDVDSDDFAIFQSCVRGPGIPADPNCGS
jgi:hypothetical protein